MKKTKKMLLVGSAFAVALVTQYGCTGPTVLADSVPKEVAGPLTSGTVVETMNAGGYTYIQLENAGQRNWVAVPIMDVKPGQKVELQPGAEMGPFKSVSLNRTFEKIIFSTGPRTGTVSAAQTLPAGHPTIPAVPAMQPAGHPAVGASPVAPAATTMPESVPAPKQMVYVGKVVETLSAGGYTYICLEKDGVQSWAAIPVTEIKLGEEVEIRKGMAMGKFTSKALNRTFENIIFTDGIISR